MISSECLSRVESVMFIVRSASTFFLQINPSICMSSASREVHSVYVTSCLIGNLVAQSHPRAVRANPSSRFLQLSYQGLDKRARSRKDQAVWTCPSQLDVGMTLQGLCPTPQVAPGHPPHQHPWVDWPPLHLPSWTPPSP